MMTIHTNDEVLIDGRMVGWLKPRDGGRGRRWRYGTDFIAATDVDWTTRVPLAARADKIDEHAALEIELRNLLG